MQLAATAAKTWIKSQRMNEFCGTWHHFTFLTISFSAPFVSCVVCCRSRRQNLNNSKCIAFSLWRRRHPRESHAFYAHFSVFKSRSFFFAFFIPTAPIIQRQIFCGNFYNLENSLSSTHTPTREHCTRTSAHDGKCRLFCFSYVELVFTAVDHMRRHIDRRGGIYFMSERVFIVSRARGHIHVDLYARVQTAI